MRALEVACWAATIALLGFCAVAYIGGELERRQAIAEFTQPRPAIAVRDTVLPPDSAPPTPADIDLPAPAAVVPSALTAVELGTAPIALLRIPRVALEVPVFPDTSERNLNRGAGWIKGTAAPDQIGNVAIAAHRDRYFRVLKDVAVGDVLELESHSQRRSYRVSEISIVQPEDVSSLRPTETNAVTLVTCYPFYFVGHAPQRYIVRAVAMK